MSDYKANFDAYGDKTTVQYNFCKYVDKKCATESPYYYAAAYNSTDCYYLNENAVNRTSYELINLPRETGLKITYYDVRETGQTFELNLLCDEAVKGYSMVNRTTVDDRRFIAYARSKNICPQKISTVLAEFFGTFKWIFFAVGLIVGPIELLLGHKIFKLTVFLVG